MDIEIMNEKKNDLLHRREMVALLKGCDATPKAAEVSSALSAKLGVAEPLVVIRKIAQKFGSSDVECTAKVYDNEENKKKIEPKAKDVKKEGAEENK